MDEELSELKKVLRSLVVSSPTNVDVRALLRDYREMVGGKLPIAKYGYQDPVKFLMERCSDSFQFQGPSDNPVLNLIVTDSIKHIDKFVRSQKISAAAKVKGKRQSVQRTANSPAVAPLKPPKDLIHASFTHRKEMTTRSRSSAPPCQIDADNQNHNQNKNQSIRRTEEERKAKVECAPRMGTPNHNLNTDNDSVQTSSSDRSESRRRALFQVKANIKELVSGYSEGLWCTELPHLYQERFGRELKFEKFGNTSLISLLLELGDEIVVTRPNPSDWLLQPLSAATRHPGPPPPPQAPYVSWASRLPAALHSDEDALPGVAIEPGVFPEDCMAFNASIPSLGVEEMSKGTLLEVIVTEVYSPSHFWIQRLGEEYNLAVEELMDQMDQYYRGEGASRRLSVGAVRVGHYVACTYEDSWHRAIIVRIVDSETVKVRHVDYATVCSVNVKRLRPLLKRFGALPVQALRATLGGIRPPAGGRRWPQSAGAYLLALVSDKRLVARVHAVDRQNSTLEVQLIDTSGDDDVYLAERLLRAAHADPQPGSVLQSNECYLLPTFDALESGHTLSFSEIHQFLRDGIDIEFLDDYRHHVAPLAPPPPPLPSPPPLPPSSPLPPPSVLSPSPPAQNPILGMVPLQMPLTLYSPPSSSFSTPPPTTPPSAAVNLAPEVYQRFLALSTVDHALANQYMVEEIKRAQAHVTSAWGSGSTPSQGWGPGPTLSPAWGSDPTPNLAWGSDPTSSLAWGSGPRTGACGPTPVRRAPPGFGPVPDD